MKDIDTLVEELEELAKSDDLSVLSAALLGAIDVIKTLHDENVSAWFMLEESRASDIKNHSDALKFELDKKINEVFSLISKKVIKA